MPVCYLLFVPAIVGVYCTLRLFIRTVRNARREALVDFLDDYLRKSVVVARKSNVDWELQLLSRRLTEMQDRHTRTANYNRDQLDHLSGQLSHQAECILKLDKAFKARKR